MNRTITSTLILLFIMSAIIVYCPGCTGATITPVITYKTFEMKPNDVRLRFLQHPLFSFEYPEVFNLIDLNLIYEQEPAFTHVSGLSDVHFTIQQTDLPEPFLSVTVQKPGLWGYNDANAVFKDWISTAESNGDTITTSERTVSGIRADYLQTFGIKIGLKKPDGTPIYPDHQQSFRGAVFDYAGLVWSISITWDYHSSEPPEVQGYFEHVIETFKILD